MKIKKEFDNQDARYNCEKKNTTSLSKPCKLS